MHVDLKNAYAGMTLGADVVSAKGQLLLKAGATLNGKHLQLLLANGVQQVEVGGPPSATEEPQQDMAAVERHLEERFRICDNRHPVIRELRRLSRERLVASPLQGEGDDER